LSRIRRFALIVASVLSGLHAYIGWRLLPALPIEPAWKTVGVALLVLSALLIPFGMLARFLTGRQALADRATWVGSLLMGLFSSLLVLTVVRDLVLAFSPTSFAAPSAVFVPIAAAAITIIGYVNARRLPRVLDVRIPLAGLPPELAGFTIVQISDLHVGPTIKREYVQAVVDRVNLLTADLVAITGDVVDGTVDQLGADTAPLADLASRHGTYVVTGNHEYYSGATEWWAEFARLGLYGLMNEHVLIEHDGARLVLAGVSDYNAHAFDAAQRSDPAKALSGAPASTLKILLAHQPRSAADAAAAGFDLQLSGHTHGGQFWPWPLLVRLQQPYTAGLRRLNRLWVYTSRGTGYWGPPKRFGVPAEITRIMLYPDAKIPSRSPSRKVGVGGTLPTRLSVPSTTTNT
jgi:hypothetical protein